MPIASGMQSRKTGNLSCNSLLSARAFWTGPGVGSGVFINRNLAFRVQRIQATYKSASYPEAGPVVLTACRGMRSAISQHIKQYRNVVHQTTGQHKQMPDAVPVLEALIESVEDNTDCVKQAARRQPGKTRLTQRA